MNTSEQYALQLDNQDELAFFRDRFHILDPDIIYLDGNSLGRLPLKSIDLIKRAVEHEWGNRLIRSWNEHWIDLSTRLGIKVASLIGAGKDEVIITDATSLNLFKLAVAALRLHGRRNKIVSDELNFPSDLYILQGIVDLLGNHHSLCLARSMDSITIDEKDLAVHLDESVALVCLTHVAFRSAFMYDLKKVTGMAHEAGALMLWDLSHSVGAVPLNVKEANVDLAVGCTYKYMNGGPGAPAFLYVRKDLQEKLNSPLWGWMGASNPFKFDLEFEPAAGISRYQVGTPPVLSMCAIEPGLELLLEAGMDKIRKKSVQQSKYLIHLFDHWLAPIGFTFGSPWSDNKRGSHVSICHPEAYRINLAMIKSKDSNIKVIPDFREPDNIRLGIAPLYTRFIDIYRAMERIRTIVEKEIFKKYSEERSGVT